MASVQMHRIRPVHELAKQEIRGQDYNRRTGSFVYGDSFGPYLCAHCHHATKVHIVISVGSPKQRPQIHHVRGFHQAICVNGHLTTHTIPVLNAQWMLRRGADKVVAPGGAICMTGRRERHKVTLSVGCL